MKMITSLLSSLVLFTLASAGIAENSSQTGGYTIHHNAITTDNLPPQVANAYGIQRSKSRALLTVSVIRDEKGTTGKPVHAQIKTVAKTLFGQVRDIKLREVDEDQAVYYIADFPVANREMLLFDFEIQPEDGAYPLRAQMRQEFFTD